MSPIGRCCQATSGLGSVASYVMCGIVAVVATTDTRPAADSGQVLGALQEGLDRLRSAGDVTVRLATSTASVRRCDHMLYGLPGVLAARSDAGLVIAVRRLLESVTHDADRIELSLDDGSAGLEGAALEAASRGLVNLRDAVWAVGRDRCRTAEAVLTLAGRDANRPALAATPGTGPCAAATKLSPVCTEPGFPAFNVFPDPSVPRIPINFGTGQAQFTLNMRLSKTIGIGPKPGAAPAGGESQDPRTSPHTGPLDHGSTKPTDGAGFRQPHLAAAFRNRTGRHAE